MSSSLGCRLMLRNGYSTREQSLIEPSGGTFKSYQIELERNLAILLQKFPEQNALKLRNHLQEFENNLVAVVELLEEEKISSSAILDESSKKWLHLGKSKDSKDQTMLLKQLLVSMMKQMKEQTKKINELENVNMRLKRHNEFLGNILKLSNNENGGNNQHCPLVQE